MATFTDEINTDTLTTTDYLIKEANLTWDNFSTWDGVQTWNGLLQNENSDSEYIELTDEEVTATLNFTDELNVA